MKNRNRKVARAVARANGPRAQTGRAACVHLGDVVPRQTGPCGQKVRKCSEFGQCTLTRCAGVGHACDDCDHYEADG
jgi:hypothetical protein